MNFSTAPWPLSQRGAHLRHAGVPAPLVTSSLTVSADLLDLNNGEGGEKERERLRTRAKPPTPAAGHRSRTT